MNDVCVSFLTFSFCLFSYETSSFCQLYHQYPQQVEPESWARHHVYRILRYGCVLLDALQMDVDLHWLMNTNVRMRVDKESYQHPFFLVLFHWMNLPVIEKRTDYVSEEFHLYHHWRVDDVLVMVWLNGKKKMKMRNENVYDDGDYVDHEPSKINNDSNFFIFTIKKR